MSNTPDPSRTAHAAGAASDPAVPFGYIVAEVTVTNEAQMKVYREWSSRAMQEHGAEVLVRGGRVEPLEGDWHPQRVVVLRFKDIATAQAYYHSDTYTHARQVREGAGSIRMFAVEGI